MKVLVLGASGIVGQTMRLCVPDGVEPIWFRQHVDPITHGSGDLSSAKNIAGLLRATEPDVIVNLAGESSVDMVERDPSKYEAINVQLPARLADWSWHNKKRLIQISSQAVFSGLEPPYSPIDRDFPVNDYGQQKCAAEAVVLASGQQVMRLTFILGIRPLPHVGRQNPFEAMIAGQSPQVCDRWFSPLMAWDAAEQIWQEVVRPSGDRIIQCGIPERWSRYEIAKLVNPNVQPCMHEDFPGIAPRPIDTTYAGSRHNGEVTCGIDIARLRARNDRAIELALFFGIQLQRAVDKLQQGFCLLHYAVSEEWRARNPQTEAEILDFYRTTDSYIWELSAYHEDVGFNYSGMCEGIATRLKNEPDCKRVLCLGDGIGDLTLTLHRAGFDAWYHDLENSRTETYAAFRFWRQTGLAIQTAMTKAFDPNFGGVYDAIVSLDFMEHLPEPQVNKWMRAVFAALKPGGLAVFQNAFACGSGPDGAIPMHTKESDRYERDWDPEMSEIGFEQLAPQWYRRPA